jgi:hypothetical protein
MKNIFLFCAALLLSACGGGATDAVSIVETPTFTAFYGEKPIRGLVYEAQPSGLNGLTNQDGAFQFKAGDEVLFYLDQVNKIFIGKYTPESGQRISVLTQTRYAQGVEPWGIWAAAFVFDVSAADAKHVDVSQVQFKPDFAEKFRKFLNRKALIPGAEGLWDSFALARAEVFANYKHSVSYLSNDGFSEWMSGVFSGFQNLPVEANEFSGPYVFNLGTSNLMIDFQSNGLFRGLGDEGNLDTGTYTRSRYGIHYRWDASPVADCMIGFRIKERGPDWSVVSVQSVDDPSPCNPRSSTGVVTQAKIEATVTLATFAGKKLRLPVNGLCSPEPGEVTLELASIVSGATQGYFVAAPSVCTANRSAPGTVRESGIPGVLWFEFTDLQPRRKFALTVLQSSQRAMTSFFIEKTSPSPEFDAVYGAETAIELN